MMKALCVLVLVGVAAGCGGTEKEGNGPAVGVAYASGGKRDNSYNQSAALGAELVRQRLSLTVREVEPAQFSDLESAIQGLAQAKADLVIAVGPFYPEAVKRVAPRFPATRFVVIDGEVESLANVRSIMFREEQGSYLVGALAGLATQTGRVGAVLAMDIPVLNKFFAGYRCGVLGIRGDITVEKVIIGSGPDAFSDPIRGAESARFLLGRGVDVIYQVAGASGIGVINAVREAGKGFAIGVDSNQNGLAPGRVLTSMLKRVDLAVLEAVQEQLSGKFAPGVVRVGIEKGRRPEEDFVGYEVDSNNEGIVREDWRDRVNGLREQIRSGAITISSTVGAPCR